MSVSIALNNALTGLNINQQALTVLSQNIANANTPGYSKQIINQQSVTLGGLGEGVDIESITRKIDNYLTVAAQQQNSTAGQTNTLNDYYSKIQLLLGTPGNQDSIDSYANNFFNAVQALVQSPDNTTLQQTVVNSGVTAGAQINQLAQGLNNLQFQADQGITSAVSTVNNDLTNIYQLNQTISQETALGHSVATLEDQRDGAIKDISQYMSVSTFEKSDGSIFLTTSNGTSILDNSLYQLSYAPATSAASFGNNSVLSPLTVSPVNQQGEISGTTVNLTSSAPPSQVTSVLQNGSLSALISLRDQVIPNISDQLDSVAATLRDQVNAVNNSGSGYPGANSLTGQRAVYASDYSQWSGKAQIAVLDSNGQPIPSPYADEPYGKQPLTLNLAQMNTGNGTGNPSVQGIVNAINQYYGAPQNKTELGNLNNIQLASDSSSLPNTSNKLNFDFNLNNISATSANFYVSNISVTDNSGNPMPTTSTIPTVALDPLSTYITSAGSSTVTINTTGGANNLTNGEIVYLSTPPAGPDAGGSYDGIPPASLGGYFTISNVTSSGFQISAGASAITGATYGVANQTANPPYDSAAAGADTRTGSNGTFTSDVSSSPNALFYNVTATVGVDNGSGSITTSQITYRVNNNQPATLGNLIGAQTANGAATIVSPNSNAPLVIAKLVDANGIELPKINGQYITTVPGYLKIQTVNPNDNIAINSLNSVEQGKPNNAPAIAGSNLGFSSYFALNNFFNSNKLTPTGDTVAGSALNLSVEQRIQNNNGLVSLGQLTQGSQSTLTGSLPNYTYSLNPGDNSIIANLAGVASKEITFSAAGGLGVTTQTLSGYIGQVIGGIATNASNATTNNTNAQSLLTSYTQQASAVSGVNLDTELANTVIYQNAYAASARVVTVVNSLFDTLLQVFQ